MPQIAPTVGVVTTTIMMLVMKVFDIVKVMTNGNFGTQVFANEMFTRAFSRLQHRARCGAGRRDLHPRSCR